LPGLLGARSPLELKEVSVNIENIETAFNFQRAETGPQGVKLRIKPIPLKALLF
jgi:hypothetical protein